MGDLSPDVRYKLIVQPIKGPYLGRPTQTMFFTGELSWKQCEGEVVATTPEPDTMSTFSIALDHNGVYALDSRR